MPELGQYTPLLLEQRQEYSRTRSIHPIPSGAEAGICQNYVNTPHSFWSRCGNMPELCQYTPLLLEQRLEYARTRSIHPTPSGAETGICQNEVNTPHSFWSRNGNMPELCQYTPLLLEQRREYTRTRSIHPTPSGAEAEIFQNNVNTPHSFWSRGGNIPELGQYTPLLLEQRREYTRTKSIHPTPSGAEVGICQN